MTRRKISFSSLGQSTTQLSVANVNRSPRQTAATREAPAAVWRRAGGVVGRFYPSAVMLIEPDPFSRSRLDPVPRVTPFLASCGQALGPEARVQR
jgi:hypothetical protein